MLSWSMKLICLCLSEIANFLTCISTMTLDLRPQSLPEATMLLVASHLSTQMFLLLFTSNLLEKIYGGHLDVHLEALAMGFNELWSCPGLLLLVDSGATLSFVYAI
jgi:hypothetical protein